MTPPSATGVAAGSRLVADLIKHVPARFKDGRKVIDLEHGTGVRARFAAGIDGATDLNLTSVPNTAGVTDSHGNGKIIT
jgi:hypothetical protein